VRVVLDTNVTLSGLLWNGTPRRVLEAARNGQIEIFCSAELVEELEDVLHRPKLASRLARIGSTPEELLAGYLALVIVIRAAPLPVPISVDPDDDAVLACALAARAEAVVSGDDDLLRLGVVEQIPIITAAEFLDRLAP
jgi:uncharacterized protein